MALVAVQVAILIPSTVMDVVPQHDLMARFQFFYSFYQGWYFGNQLPQWFHLVQYGEPSFFYQFTQISLLAYPIGWIASLLKIQDALSVFNFLFVVEHCVFLVGIWLLSSRLYSSLFTRAVVCCSMILCISDFLQPFFNFYFLYLFPYVLYYISLYSERDDPALLSRAVVIGIFSVPGGLAYGVPIQVLCALIFYLAMTWGKSPLRPLYARSFWLQPSLGLALLVLACCLVLIEKGLAEHAITISGRSQDGKASLADFLTYGRLPFANVGEGLLTGTFALAEGSFYVTLGGGLGLLIAGAWISDRRFWALYAMAAFLGLMALGGTVAHLTFYFPGMKYFRHLSLLWGLWKLPALLAAGFALDALLTRDGQRHLRWFPLGALVSIGFISVAVLEVVSVWRPSDAHPVFEQVLSPWPWLAIRALAYSVALACFLFAGSRVRLGPLVLCVAVLIDAATFQASILLNLPYGTPGKIQGAFMIHPPQWPVERTQFPATDEGKRRMALLAAPRPMRNATYTIAEDYVGEGHCAFPVPLFLLTERMHILLKATRSRPVYQDPILSRTLGCQVPTLQISRSVTFVPDQKHAVDLLRLDPAARVVEGQENISGGSDHADVATVTSFAPGRMTIKADVTGVPAMLFVAQTYHSGWKATVNGNEKSILPADLAVMAIPLDAGPNKVELFFDEPLAFWCSHILAAACIVFALLFLFWTAAAMRTPQHLPAPS